MRSGVFISALLAMILIAPSASAFVTGLEGTAKIGETPYELSFYIENSDDVKRPLSIQYNFPARHEAIKQPTWVEANAKEEVKVLIYPEKVLEGSEYVSRIFITLGGNRAEKNIRLDFFSENTCNVEISARETDKGMLVEMENNSYNEKEIKLDEIIGTPETWEITGEKEFTIAGNSAMEKEIEINKEGAFTGEATALFECQGMKTAEKIEFKHEETFLGGTMLGVLAGMADNETITVILLAIIAAILMIAFVARLVRILNRGSGVKK